MESIPQETETIAAKRSLRLAEKINKAREKIKKTDAWWSSSAFEAFLVGIIFLINYYLVSSYIGTTTYEYTFYSGPIIPGIAKIFEYFGVPLAYGLQLSNISLILCFPITFYYLVKVITDRKIVAILATLFVSLPAYPFAQVRIGSGLVGLDGAHISSLTVSMLGLLWLFKFIKWGGAKNLTLASLFSAASALTSPFGFSTYIIMASILTFSEMLLGLGRVKFIRFITILIFSVSLFSFWYNPHFSFWLLTGALGEEVRRTLSRLLPVSFFVLPALGAFGYLLFDRKPSLQPVFLASFFTIFFSLTSLAGGGIFPSHPSRYMSELGISISLLVAVILVKMFESLKFFEGRKLYFRLGIVILFVGLSIAAILGSGRVAFDNDVLGMWTGIEKGTIWQEREKFQGVSSVMGYVITTIGVAFLSYVNLKSRKLAT